MGFIPTEEHDKDSGDWIKEPGTYSLTLKSVEDKISKAGGNPMKALILCDESGAAIRDQLVETEKAFWKIAQFAKACGVQIAKGEELEVDASWVGKKCKAEVEMEPGEKQDFAKIDRYIPAVDSLFKAGAAPAKKTEPAPAKPAFDEEEESF